MTPSSRPLIIARKDASRPTLCTISLLVAHTCCPVPLSKSTQTPLRHQLCFIKNKAELMISNWQLLLFLFGQPLRKGEYPSFYTFWGKKSLIQESYWQAIFKKCLYYIHYGLVFMYTKHQNRSNFTRSNIGQKQKLFLEAIQIVFSYRKTS